MRRGRKNGEQGAEISPSSMSAASPRLLGALLLITTALLAGPAGAISHRGGLRQRQPMTGSALGATGSATGSATGGSDGPSGSSGGFSSSSSSTTTATTGGSPSTAGTTLTLARRVAAGLKVARRLKHDAGLAGDVIHGSAELAAPEVVGKAPLQDKAGTAVNTKVASRLKMKAEEEDAAKEMSKAFLAANAKVQDLQAESSTTNASQGGNARGSLKAVKGTLDRQASEEKTAHNAQVAALTQTAAPQAAAATVAAAVAAAAGVGSSAMPASTLIPATVTSNYDSSPIMKAEKEDAVKEHGKALQAANAKVQDLEAESSTNSSQGSNDGDALKSAKGKLDQLMADEKTAEDAAGGVAKKLPEGKACHTT